MDREREIEFQVVTEAELRELIRSPFNRPKFWLLMLISALAGVGAAEVLMLVVS